MGSPADWLHLFLLLGWALLHFIWQGAALAALAAAAFQLTTEAPLRYLTGVAVLILMLAAPVITVCVLAADPAPALFAPGFFPLRENFNPALLLPWLVEAWAMGVALLSLRFGGGFLTLGWRSRHQTRDANPRLLALAREVERRLGFTRLVRYLECDWLEAPAGLGALKPVILLPMTALTGLSEEQLRMVIAHELAHVRRWDFAVNLFQTAVGTLLFYHPAVWWLNRRIRAEREICCDEIAVAAYGNAVAYARALALLAEWKHVPSLAMAASHGLLAGRVLRLLGADARQARPLVAPLAAILLLLMVSLTGGMLVAGLGDVAVSPVPLRAPQTPVASLAPAPLVTATSEPRPAIIRKRPALRRSVRAVLPRTPFPILPPEEKVAITETPLPADTSFITVSDAPSAPAAQPQFTAEPPGETYPAATLPILALHNFGLEQTQIADYCDRYAEQTVAQGASKPLLLDGAAKARYDFFHWHCMLRNGDIAQRGGPAYAAIGAASPGHPTNVAGTWAVSFLPFSAGRTCSFLQIGNALSGTCARKEGSGAVRGVVDGKQVRWSWTYLDDQKMPAQIDFIGTVGDDGAIRGQYIQKPALGPIQIKPFLARASASPSTTSPASDRLAVQKMSPPRAIAETHTPPYYRFISLFLREQGTTLLQVALDATGTPTDVSVGNSSGSIRLDSAATQYVKEHWRWQPAMRDGKPVAATILVDVVWDPKAPPVG